jgi:hypothetical protein
MAQEKQPIDETASADKRPFKDRKQSRMEDVLRVVEEYARGQRELLKALAKSSFTTYHPRDAPLPQVA